MMFRSSHLLGGILLGALAASAIAAAPRHAKRQVPPARRGVVDKTIVQTASGLRYKVLSAGKGDKPTDSDVALINYEGKLTSGVTFDKSQQPTPMPVSGVVPGFSEALKLMSRGAKYRVWIKPSLGYGAQATGPIPANSTLVFDIELIDFLPEAVLRQMQAERMQGAGALENSAPAETAPKP